MRVVDMLTQLSLCQAVDITVVFIYNEYNRKLNNIKAWWFCNG